MIAEQWGPMEVAIVTDTPVACIVVSYVLLCSCTWTFTLTRQNSINKKDQLFSQKKKMQWLQYKDREKNN